MTLRHGRRQPRSRGLGLATATTSATFFPQFEHRIRTASFASVTDRPAICASASGSICREVPHGQVTRTRKSPKQSSSLLTWGSTRTGTWCRAIAGSSIQYASMREPVRARVRSTIGAPKSDGVGLSYPANGQLEVADLKVAAPARPRVSRWFLFVPSRYPGLGAHKSQRRVEGSSPHPVGLGARRLRDFCGTQSCSTMPCGAKCNGRHAELVNKIKGPRFNAPTTNQEVGSSNLSGRAIKSNVYSDEIGDGLYRRHG